LRFATADLRCAGAVVVFADECGRRGTMPNYLRLEAFRATPLVEQPFAHLIVPGFIDPTALPEINADYPKISSTGSFPVDQVSFGPAFKRVLDELESDDFREAFEEKFGVGLSGRPTVTTVRGRCGVGDGKIHTDSTTKIITVLIYMNESWEQASGRLRLLHSSSDINDIIVEVPPVAGTLLAFKRSDNSWHGHEPFAGERRVVQFNWLTSQSNRQIAMLRHHTSASFKRVLQMILPGRA
jgi:SM-20-related protein